MDVSAEHLVEQARERFQLQDYYGAIHLLEEVVTAGRAFADAHHMLGLCYSLVGQQDQALAQLDRALGLNPHYVEALVHRAIVLNELGREAEADAAFRRAAQVGGEPRQGFAAHVASKLANQHAALGDAYLGAGGLTQAIGQYQEALALGPAFHDLRYKLGNARAALPGVPLVGEAPPPPRSPARLRREILLRIASHLVFPLPFLLPLYRPSFVYQLKLRLGMQLYDLLSLDKSLPRRQHLDRDIALQPRVARPVHLSHPACAERPEDLVRPETGPARKCHRMGRREFYAAIRGSVLIR